MDSFENAEFFTILITACFEMAGKLQLGSQVYVFGGGFYHLEQQLGSCQHKIPIPTLTVALITAALGKNC